MSARSVLIEDDGVEAPPGRWVERRIGVIWLLLLFNAMPSQGVATVVPIPYRLSQLFTMGALALAMLLALSLNRRRVIRPNVVLGLLTVLAAVALLSSVRGMAGIGGVLRCVRFAAFLSVLWLLTPWMGRRDLLLAKCHFRAMLIVTATVLLGVIVAPSLALNGPGGRLAGALWPIWPTAVAHFAAVAVGMSVVLWLSGSMAGIRTALISAIGVAMVLLSHTRVAVVALVAALACSALTLFLARRRVRRVVTVGLLLAPIALALLAPTLTEWFERGQSSEELSGLTGRKQVWDQLLAHPRPEFNEWFGYGLSDKSFAGRPIDSTWLAVYHDTGLAGVMIVASIMLFLLISAAFQSPGKARALVVFLAVYVAVDSYTEVGIGDVSPYVLDAVAAASLLVPARRGESDREEHMPP